METNFQKSASNFLSPVQSTEISILLGERGLVETNFKKSTSNFQVQSCTVISIWGGLMETNFQLLMLSSNLLKSKIPMLRVGSLKPISKSQLQIFKSNPELKFPFCRGRGSWKPTSKSQLQIF